jgi:hypothetical protein
MTWQEDMQRQLKETSKNFVTYSIASDESTGIKDTLQFAGSI